MCNRVYSFALRVTRIIKGTGKVVYIFGVIYFGSYLLSVLAFFVTKIASDANGGFPLDLGSMVIAVGIVLMDVVMDEDVK